VVPVGVPRHEGAARRHYEQRQPVHHVPGGDSERGEPFAVLLDSDDLQVAGLLGVVARRYQEPWVQEHVRLHGSVGQPVPCPRVGLRHLGQWSSPNVHFVLRTSWPMPVMGPSRRG